jgi:hypothetical protein
LDVARDFGGVDPSTAKGALGVIDNDGVVSALQGGVTLRVLRRVNLVLHLEPLARMNDTDDRAELGRFQILQERMRVPAVRSGEYMHFVEKKSSFLEYAYLRRRCRKA